MSNNDLHLDVYLDHSDFYHDGEVTVFEEGNQTQAAQKRYLKVLQELNSGFLNGVYDNCGQVDISPLDNSFKKDLNTLVDGVTSEVGRALVGLCFLQITIKTITPEQCIRLHKGSTRAGSFSWKEGISMRRLDAQFTGPFLREKGLLNVNKDGVMMTRSLAENYPYSKLYKAEMRGAFDTWIKIVDALESGSVDAGLALAYMMSLLINKSNHFEQLADLAIQKVHSHRHYSFSQVKKMLSDFFTNTQYSARAFEVVIHGFMQAYVSEGFTDLSLVPLSQMRSANKKHGNVGDIELKEGRRIIESWDAKYGKSYLYEELGELQDKLEANGGAKIAGFIVNGFLDLKQEVITRANDVAIITETDIRLYTFDDWVSFELDGIDKSLLDSFGNEWLNAVVESFARRRLSIAPIDEPCEGWLNDLISYLS